MVVSGLLVQAAAVGIGFTSVGWRWPVVGAGVLVSLGCLFVVFADDGKLRGLKYGVIGFCMLVLALALGHSLSTHPAIAWSLRVGVVIQFLFLCLVVGFMILFKMSRLF